MCNSKFKNLTLRIALLMLMQACSINVAYSFAGAGTGAGGLAVGGGALGTAFLYAEDALHPSIDKADSNIAACLADIDAHGGVKSEKEVIYLRKEGGIYLMAKYDRKNHKAYVALRAHVSRDVDPIVTGTTELNKELQARRLPHVWVESDDSFHVTLGEFPLCPSDVLYTFLAEASNRATIGKNHGKPVTHAYNYLFGTLKRTDANDFITYLQGPCGTTLQGMSGADIQKHLAGSCPLGTVSGDAATFHIQCQDFYSHLKRDFKDALNKIGFDDLVSNTNFFENINFFQILNLNRLTKNLISFGNGQSLTTIISNALVVVGINPYNYFVYKLTMSLDRINLSEIASGELLAEEVSSPGGTTMVTNFQYGLNYGRNPTLWASMIYQEGGKVAGTLKRLVQAGEPYLSMPKLIHGSMSKFSMSTAHLGASHGFADGVLKFPSLAALVSSAPSFLPPPAPVSATGALALASAAMGTSVPASAPSVPATGAPATTTGGAPATATVFPAPPPPLSAPKYSAPLYLTPYMAAVLAGHSALTEEALKTPTPHHVPPLTDPHSPAT